MCMCVCVPMSFVVDFRAHFSWCACLYTFISSYLLLWLLIRRNVARRGEGKKKKNTHHTVHEQLRARWLRKSLCSTLLISVHYVDHQHSTPRSLFHRSSRFVDRLPAFGSFIRRRKKRHCRSTHPLFWEPSISLHLTASLWHRIRLLFSSSLVTRFSRSTDTHTHTHGPLLHVYTEMLAAPALAEHAVSLVLSMLLRKKQVRAPVKEVLISTSQPVLAMRVLEKANCRDLRMERTPTHRSREQAAFQTGSPSALNLLLDVPGFGSAPEPDPGDTQFVILTTGTSQTPPARQSTVLLPLSLPEVARFHRDRHQERLPSLSASRDRAASTALLEGTRQEGTTQTILELYCGPASKDLMIMDIPADVAVDDYLWEGLLVAESMLEEDGTLLVVSPHAFSARVRRFLQWRFLRTKCAVSQACCAHYSVCTTLATDFGDAAVRRDDFPGHLAAGKRRPRKWNPYCRSEKQKFVASLRPGFTNAPLIKDALRCSVERERDAQERLRDADDAFFAVAREMVEKGVHYSHPND
ncbi:hypothetical protein, conserved [Leishmania tarentolae]|uniref:Uncharacterized protein n=1 Tax=Leishmania tarentolae TaxID=5689 RepID=A0A640KK86_LEITA|nr:hypothetical protein, conserved [Leishmania tarentolae]